MPLMPTSPGELIKAGRERAGVHMAVLSVNLKVTVKQLEALEADQFDFLSGPVFARALAAKVCRFVKMDPAPVLALMPANASGLKPLNIIGADHAPAYQAHHSFSCNVFMGRSIKLWLLVLLVSLFTLFLGSNWIVSVFQLEASPAAMEVVPSMPPAQESTAPDAAQNEMPKAMVFDSVNNAPLTPVAPSPSVVSPHLIPASVNVLAPSLITPAATEDKK